MTFGDGIDWNAEARRAAKAGQPGPQPGELIRRVALHVFDKTGSACATEKPVLVDCGCNIARFYPETNTAGLQYIGIDQADEAILIAKSRYPSVRFIRSMLWDDWPTAIKSPITPIDYAPTQVHAVICNAVLQHNTHPEKHRILARIAQAVPVGGTFAMQESTVPAETKTQLRQGDWIKLVEGYGFKLVEMWHPNDEFAILDGYLFTRIGR